MQKKKDDVDIEQLYGKYSTCSKDEFISNFKVKDFGLSNNEIQKNYDDFGSNEISRCKAKKMV